MSDVIMQVAYRRGVGISVPCPLNPADGPNVPWFIDRIAEQATEISEIGVGAFLYPPLLKGSGLNDGYDTFDDYDLASKDQKIGGMATTFAPSRTNYQRTFAIARSNGIKNYIDLVEHQRIGGTAESDYNYVNSAGTKASGRFPKTASCFFKYQVDSDGNLIYIDGQLQLVPGYVPIDPIVGPVIYAVGVYAFGDPLCPVNALPTGYVMMGLLDAADWYITALGVDGGRLDDVKAQSLAVIKNLVQHKSLQNKPWIGEYIDAPQTVQWWMQHTGCMAYDFSFQGIIRNICNNNSRTDMRQLVWGTPALFSISDQAVGFVENPDTDTDGFASVIDNKAEGYFLLMTLPFAKVQIYYKDWSTDKGCYGMKKSINNYAWIRLMLANGHEFKWRQTEYQYLVYERSGYVLCGVNNDQYNWQTIRDCQTDFWPGTRLHDVTGHNPIDCYVNEWGQIPEFGIPPNDNGMGTVAWALFDGQDHPIKPTSYGIVQSFVGDVDLDIAPAMNGVAYTIPFSIYMDSAGHAAVHFLADQTNWTSLSKIQITATANDGAILTSIFLTQTDASIDFQVADSVSSDVSFTILGMNLPAIGSSYVLTVTYKSPKE